MEATTTDVRALQRERLRTSLGQKGMSPSALAGHVGRESHYFRDFLNGKKKNISSQTLALAAGVLEVSAAYLQGEDREPSVQPSLGRQIPLYRAMFTNIENGFGDFRHVGDVPCPPQLLRVSGPYAVAMPDDAMEPRFAVGDVLIVNPSLHPAPGNSVVVQLAEDGKNVATVREFVSRSPGKMVVRQLNPERRSTISLDKVLVVYVVHIHFLAEF